MIINELKNSKIPKIQIVSKLKSLQTQYSQYFQRTYYFNIKTLMKTTKEFEEAVWVLRDKIVEKLRKQ
jgi:hypothetical protein